MLSNVTTHLRLLSVSRLIEGKGAAVVVVSKDAIHMTKLAGASFMTSPVDKKTGLHSHITEMCLLRGVPLLVVPKMNEELSKVLRIRKASCFAIPTNDYIIKSLAKKKEDHGLESGVDINDSFYGVLDSVRDALAALAMREK